MWKHRAKHAEHTERAKSGGTRRRDGREGDSHIPKRLLEISSVLFTLSNKSQEQITPEYELRLDEMEELTASLIMDVRTLV